MNWQYTRKYTYSKETKMKKRKEQPLRSQCLQRRKSFTLFVFCQRLLEGSSLLKEVFFSQRRSCSLKIQRGFVVVLFSSAQRFLVVVAGVVAVVVGAIVEAVDRADCVVSVLLAGMQQSPWKQAGASFGQSEHRPFSPVAHVKAGT